MQEFFYSGYLHWNELHSKTLGTIFYTYTPKQGTNLTKEFPLIYKCLQKITHLKMKDMPQIRRIYAIYKQNTSILIFKDF